MRLDEKLIKRENIIYVDSPTFRSPYFSPTKTIFGNKLTTYSANLGAIWFFSLILILMLYFDFFKRVGDTIDVLTKKIRKKSY